jgi:hypothetical protein
MGTALKLSRSVKWMLELLPVEPDSEAGMGREKIGATAAAVRMNITERLI